MEIMRFFCLIFCCGLAGCTSSSRLANPLGLDLDPVLNLIDEQRPVQVVYPAGAPRTSLQESYGSEWQMMTRGYPSNDFKE